MAKAGFYAVKHGRVPGVYTNWDDCRAQVEGYPGAAYQKFKTEAEAEMFVGKVVEKVEQPVSEFVVEEPVVQTAVEPQKPVSLDDVVTKNVSEKKPSAYYAVRVGKVPGVYHTWAECKAQVTGVQGAKYRKFTNEGDALDFMVGVDVPKPEKIPAKRREMTKMPEPDGPYAFVDGSFNPDTGVYGYGGFVNVFGRKYPVYGSDSDPEMASMRNVAGEIAGAMAAVKKAESLHIRDLTILYDYRGIEEWAVGNWKTNKVKTQEYAEFMNPENRLVELKFQKVAAHTGIEGNEMADVMAKNAVGIDLTVSQQELLKKALSCGKRDGISNVSVDNGSEFSSDLDFE